MCSWVRLGKSDWQRSFDVAILVCTDSMIHPMNFSAHLHLCCSINHSYRIPNHGAPSSPNRHAWSKPDTIPIWYQNRPKLIYAQKKQMVIPFISSSNFPWSSNTSKDVFEVHSGNRYENKTYPAKKWKKNKFCLGLSH